MNDVLTNTTPQESLAELLKAEGITHRVTATSLAEILAESGISSAEATPATVTINGEEHPLESLLEHPDLAEHGFVMTDNGPLEKLQIEALITQSAHDEQITISSEANDLAGEERTGINVHNEFIPTLTAAELHADNPQLVEQGFAETPGAEATDHERSGVSGWVDKHPKLAALAVFGATIMANFGAPTQSPVFGGQTQDGPSLQTQPVIPETVSQTTAMPPPQTIAQAFEQAAAETSEMHPPQDPKTLAEKVADAIEKVSGTSSKNSAKARGGGGKVEYVTRDHEFGTSGDIPGVEEVTTALNQAGATIADIETPASAPSTPGSPAQSRTNGIG